MSTSTGGFRQYASEVSRLFFGLAVLIPLGAALVALGTGRADAINLVHVVAGASWAGATIYIAGVLSPTLVNLDPGSRAQVSLPLIPKHILLYSSLALVTLVTGATLAGVSGRDHTALVIITAYLAGAALLVVAAYLVRIQGQIYGEVHGGEPDMERIEGLATNLGKAGVIGAVLQVVTLVVMALVRVA